jgi:hypothetical protein
MGELWEISQRLSPDEVYHGHGETYGGKGAPRKDFCV